MSTRAVVTQQDATTRTERSARHWTWISRAMFAMLILATIFFGGYLAAANLELRGQLEESADRLAESQAEASALYEQLLAAGEDPVVEPSQPGAPGEIGPQGVPGSQGVPGTRGEIGPQGVPGVPGVPGAPGADGADGKDGKPGANGQPGESVVGPPGPAGLAGPQGEQGVPGMNGIGVTGVSCVLLDDLSTAFRFTFSDASFVDVPGACLP